MAERRGFFGRIWDTVRSALSRPSPPSQPTELPPLEEEQYVEPTPTYVEPDIPEGGYYQPEQEFIPAPEVTIENVFTGVYESHSVEGWKQLLVTNDKYTLPSALDTELGMSHVDIIHYLEDEGYWDAEDWEWFRENYDNL